SPVVNGFSGELAYSLGEQAGSNSAGRQMGAALAYANGPLNVRLGYNNRNSDVSAAAGAAMTPPIAASSRDIGTNTLLAANYDFGIAEGYIASGRDKAFNSAALPNTSIPYGAVNPTAPTNSRHSLLRDSQPPAGGRRIRPHS